MTNAQKIGGGLVLLGGAALLYFYWKRRGQQTTLSQGFQDYLMSWSVAPAQPATPNTPTRAPVTPSFGDVRGGSSTG